MSEVAIEVCNVWKKFRRGELHDSLRDIVPAVTKRLLGRGPRTGELADDDFWALKDVSFQVDRGEALGIIGANGAGKSTMLKILSRILRPNRGHFRVSGRLSALIEVAAGFHPDLSGRENIYLNGAIMGMKKREIERKLEEIIDFSGIEPFIDTPVKRYSSGMQARLGFSVMAHMEHEILLVDEVLSVGDVAFRAKCVRRMMDLIQSDVSVVFISHRLDDIRRVCDRCLVLDAGSVRFLGKVGRACREYLESLPNQGGRNDHRSRFERTTTSGRLLGVTMLEDGGPPTIRVRSHRPMALDVSYVLNRDLENVGLRVRFHGADGTPVASCVAFGNEVGLPSVAGTHTVRLKLEGLPFSGGDYLIGLRLFDIAGDATIDRHEQQYPLVVDGPGDGRHPVYLAHEWTSDSSTTGYGS